jgi:hypothetical protein
VRLTTVAAAEWQPGPGHDFTDTSVQPVDPATGTYADW